MRRWKKSVVVPSVLGLSMRDASLKLSEVGLRIKVVGTGLAYEQSPAAGTKVLPGGGSGSAV